VIISIINVAQERYELEDRLIKGDHTAYHRLYTRDVGKQS
jgi:hypothetical protein